MENIIREVPAEQSELSSFFDGDTFTSSAGDYCYNLFIVSFDHGRVYGFNTDEYERIQSHATELADGFTDVQDKVFSGSYKDVMHDCAIPYSSVKCHKLKEWANHYSPDDAAGIAAFLSIVTGRKWEYLPCHGYSQGDYCEVIYCPEFNSDSVAHEAGEIWLGCAKEFCTIELDENGKESDACYGYIVADCQVRADEDYKKLVCEWAGLNPEETQLEMISGYHSRITYDYRFV